MSQDIETDVIVRNYSDLTDSQNLWISCLVLPTGILSICGSCMIIRDVFHHKNKKSYELILCALSIFDILISTTFIGERWLTPKDHNDKITSFGNHATCQTLGFFLQLGSASFHYSGVLAFYCT